MDSANLIHGEERNYDDCSSLFFFFKDTATTEIYTLSLHDALPICSSATSSTSLRRTSSSRPRRSGSCRSEEHTSELQSPYDLVCRLLLEKKKKKKHAFDRYKKNKKEKL